MIIDEQRNKERVERIIRDAEWRIKQLFGDFERKGIKRWGEESKGLK